MQIRTSKRRRKNNNKLNITEIVTTTAKHTHTYTHWNGILFHYCKPYAKLNGTTLFFRSLRSCIGLIYLYSFERAYHTNTLLINSIYLK